MHVLLVTSPPSGCHLGPQPPQLSPSAGEWGRKATAEQKWGAKAEAVKPEISNEFPEHAVKLLPSSFTKAVGSELFPSQPQGPVTTKPKKAKRVRKLAIKVPKTPKVKLVVENKGNDDEDDECTAASGKVLYFSAPSIGLPILPS